MSACPFRVCSIKSNVFKGIVEARVEARIEARHIINTLRRSDLCTTFERLKLFRWGILPRHAFYVGYTFLEQKSPKKENRTKQMRLNVRDTSKR